MDSDLSKRDAWTPTGAEECSEVSATLDDILSSAQFRSSRRYPAMLRYVIEKALHGDGDSLKERTIGVEVFGRNPDYDTNADPVVRFSAGEVRKRLAQFYQEHGSNHPIEIELPLGTYVPRFHRRATPPEALHGAVSAPQPDEAHGTVPSAVPPARGDRRSHRLVYALLLIAAISSGATFFFRVVRRPNPVLQVWAPLLSNADPVLISVGQPQPLDKVAPEPPNISIGDHILRPEFRVSITTVGAIANIVGFLQSQHKQFRIHQAYSNTLDDLHGRPVVLVNANNNKWTLLLLKPFRFHFVQVGQFAYIDDAHNPAFRGWNVDFSQPYSSQTADYAIVSRFNSATTGAPVIVVAGISSNGTEAAGEFIVSPEFMAELMKDAPKGWDIANGSFEAVLKVEVVSGNTGASTVVASQFW